MRNVAELVKTDGAEARIRSAAEFEENEELQRIAEGGTKAIRSKVWSLAWPSLAEMTLQNVLQMIVMIMVGWVGPEAVAAVGLTNQPIFFALAIFMALNVGSTAIVARAIGAGNREEANRAAQQTMSVNLLLSIVIAFLGYAFAEDMLRILQAEPEVLKEGVPYAQIMLLSLSFTVVSMSMSAVLRGAGDTKTPMKINVLSNVLVVVLGFPLIYGLPGIPGLGVVGAAVATAIARLVATLWVTWVLFSGQTLLRLTVKDSIRFDRDIFRRIVRIGLPSAGEQFAMRAGQLIFTIILAGLGTTAVAAHSICFSILGLSFMPGMAFAAAASSLVGQGLGARNPELAERFGWETSRYGRIFAGAMSLVFLLFAPYILRMYTNDPNVIEQGTVALRIIGIVQISQASQFILAGALRGAGDTRIPLYSMIIGVLIVRVALCMLFVLVFHWGIVGAYLSMAADQIARSTIIYFRYRSGLWKKALV